MEAEEYRRMFALEDHYWWFLAKRRLVLMLIQQFAPQAKVTLDVGCGTGGTGAALRARGAHWFGIDRSVLALSLCRERGLTGLAMGSVESVPVRSGSVDLLLLLDVLYHRAVHDDRQALADCIRVLAPGGTVIFTDSALSWLRGPHDEAVHTRKRYRLGEIVAMVQECGLQVVKRSYANSLLLPLIAAYRLGRRLFPTDQAHSDIVDLPSWVQRVLLAAQSAERYLLRHLSLPLGSSVVLVGRKP